VIKFSSIYGVRTGEPLIHFEWGKEKGELTITEARAHAIAVLETWEAAIGDAFLFEFIEVKVGDPAKPNFMGANMLQEFRAWRQQRGFGGGVDPTGKVSK
jgi:hypothetical protein